MNTKWIMPSAASFRFIVLNNKSFDVWYGLDHSRLSNYTRQQTQRNADIQPWHEPRERFELVIPVFERQKTRSVLD